MLTWYLLLARYNRGSLRIRNTKTAGYSKLITDADPIPLSKLVVYSPVTEYQLDSFTNTQYHASGEFESG